MGLLVAGTKYRGEFEERLKKLMDEIKQNDDIILVRSAGRTAYPAGCHRSSPAAVRTCHASPADVHILTAQPISVTIISSKARDCPLVSLLRVPTTADCVLESLFSQKTGNCMVPVRKSVIRLCVNADDRRGAHADRRRRSGGRH